MQARFKLENPKAIEATLTLTLTLEQWERLREQLEYNWPGSDLRNVITDLLAQARKVYWPNEEEGECK